MSLDEKAINSVNEYFSAIAQNAVDNAYGIIDEETTFTEFMENVTNYLHQFASEHVASEVLEMSSQSIEKYNGGTGIYVDDIQALIENKDGEDEDEDDAEDEIDHD
jgi:hypothetical protein